APILNALHILSGPGTDAEAFDYARGVVARQVQHLVRLGDDLLDVSRIMRGKGELRRGPVELADVGARAVETSRALLGGRRQRLEVSLPPVPVRLEADPVRLAQVLANLLNNAAKYTPEGGHVWLSAEAADGWATLRVRDDGIGIAPEMLPRVFDLF